MKNMVIGIVLGMAILFSVLYIQSINTRVSGIEKFLNNAIQNQQKKPAAPMPAE